MKKIILFIGIFSVMLCVLALPVFASSYKDVSDGMYYTDSVEKLTTYGIVSGFDGYFEPNAKLTRAEFAKVTALVAGLEDSAFNNMSYKKFDDVEADHWSAGYVNTVAENRLIVGYTDGTFKPDKNVTYAEALTVILRTLDYTSADLGDNWPYAYITKANALGLTDNLSFDQNDSITRANLCVIIDRALRTELNKSSDKLISKLDVSTEYTDAVTVYSDIYTALETVGVTKNEINNSKIFRDGYLVSIDDVHQYDVAYFNRAGMKIYLYSDKISGTYSKAFPSKVDVTSIELGGNTFEIETQIATNKLGEKNDSYKIGSKITLLLGMDGKIADVVDLNSSDRSNYGILLSYTTEMSDDILEKGKQYNYITVINGEGNTVKYKVKEKVDNFTIGHVGKLRFDADGYATFEGISSTTAISGTVDKNSRKIGNNWLTTDCIIIERVAPYTFISDGVTANVIDFEDIIPTELTEDNVIWALTEGEFDDISVLFVENISSEQYQFGILKNIKGNVRGTSTSGQYEIYSQGQLLSYSTNFYKKIETGSAVAMTFKGNTLASIDAIKTVVSSKKVEKVDFSRIKIGSNIYELSDDVQVIKVSSSNYTAMSKKDIESLKGKTVSLFADSNTEKGGLIRIILIID